MSVNMLNLKIQSDPIEGLAPSAKTKHAAIGLAAARSVRRQSLGVMQSPKSSDFGRRESSDSDGFPNSGFAVFR